MANNKPFGQNVSYGIDGEGNVLLMGDRGTEAKVKAKANALQQAKKEASRLASMANKRIKRLEANDLKDSPAYKMYVETGGKFSVKGKSWNELQKELARLRKFIDAKTSTIKGTNQVLKEMAENIGVSYSNLKELRAKSAKFFELSSKVEQYLRTVNDMASAIGYQKIWEAVNVYTQRANVDLSDSDADIDNMVEAISQELAKYPDKGTPISGLDSGWFELN
jgi:hypothetical protein